MSKKINKRRQAIYDKSSGVCWYCGESLLGKRWHEDHFYPIRRNNDGTCVSPQYDIEENKVPSCASCNKLKSSLNIESFRKYINGFVDSLNKYTNQYKFAKRYGQIQETRHPVVFWFEANKKQIDLPSHIIEFNAIKSELERKGTLATTIELGPDGEWLGMIYELNLKYKSKCDQNHFAKLVFNGMNRE